MKEYPPRRKYSVCECGHKFQEHEMTLYFTMSHCLECMCPKYKEEYKAGSVIE